jgi:K(+)-stimulated pyrophosphate-energized sodium pump
MAMVEEVRRQFRTIPGIMEGTGKPEYDKCVAISTEASIKKMMLPGALAIVSPLIIGFAFGPEALGGFLAGATVSGVLIGMFQNNAGGAWDNAKKSFEKGVEINGEIYKKKSEPHKAAVTGDTVGDPFKDTSGPSMNILIKLTCLVGLTIAPILGHSDEKKENSNNQKVETVAPVVNEISKVVEVLDLGNGNVKEVVTKYTIVNGVTESTTSSTIRPMSETEKAKIAAEKK